MIEIAVVDNGKNFEAQRLNGFDGEVNPLVMKKLVPREELAALGIFFRSRHTAIAFTTGAYDMVHVGHVRYLELAATLGEILVVGLNSDSSVKALKGESRPILNEKQRAEMLCYLASVTYVTIFPELTGGETIRLLKPDAYLCVEGSWNGDLASKDEAIAITESGGKVFYAPRQSPTLSTSAIIEKVRELERPGIIAELRQSFSNGND